MKTKVQVKDLRKGDVLSSGTVVLENPTSGFTTPNGKTDVYVQYGSGNKRVAEWNKSTTVTITNR